MKKLTISQFDLFVAECERIQPILGLQGWKIYYASLKMDGTYARTLSDAHEKIATIKLNPEWDDYGGNTPSPANLKKTALHEMLHVFMADLTGLAHSRYIDAGEIDEAEHRIVRTLDKLLEI